MLYYISLNEDNRIALLTVEQQSEEQFLFDFPSDFDISDMINYKIVDDELIYEPIPIVEPEPTVSLEDRIAELETANETLSEVLDALLMGDIEL